MKRTVTLGIPGLDAIFRHGIQPGSLILVSGPPGSGKTLVAMQLLMGMRFSHLQPDDPRQRDRLLYSGDEPRHLLKQQRDQLLRSADSHELYIRELQSATRHQSRTGNCHALARERSTGETFDLELSLPREVSSHLLRRREHAVKEIVNALSKQQTKFEAFGVDGILNLGEFHGATLEERRAALQAIAAELRRLVAWEDPSREPTHLASVMTAELPPGQGTDSYLLEEYLADVVLRVDVASPLAGKRRRRLEVLKCRYTDAIPGEHSLWIMSEYEKSRRDSARSNLGWSAEAMSDIRRGVVVFPRFRWRAEIDPEGLTRSLDTAAQPGPCCRFGIKGLDRMFERTSPGVLPGSSTVIVGEAGTGKSMLCYSFLLQGLTENNDVVFISFDQRHRSILREAHALVCDRGGLTLMDAVRAQVQAGAARHARLRFIHENPVNADLDQLMHLLGRELEACALRGDEAGRSRRLIIDSLSDLERNLPEPIVFNDFVITLLNRAADFGVTTLIAYEAERGSDRVLSDGRALPFMADNVVRIGHVEVNDTARKCVSIQKARGRKHDLSIGELLFCTDPRTGRFHLEVSKGFEGMHNVLSGHPKSAQIQLRLFTENEQEDYWNRELADEIRRHYGPDRVKSGSFALTQMRDIFWNREKGRDIQPESDVTIVSLDQPWVRLFASASTAQPLAMWDPETADPSQRLAVAQVKPTLRRHAMIETADGFGFGKMVGLPHYYDLGLLVMRTDLAVEGLPAPRHWENIEGRDADPASLETIACAFKEETGRYGFAFNTEEIESVNCLFMEMCWNFFATRDFLVNPDRIADNLERVTDALAFLARLRSGGLLPFPCTVADCGQALYSRVWYSNLFNMMGRSPAGGGSQPVPRLIPPGPQPFKPVPFLASARQDEPAIARELEFSGRAYLERVEAEIATIENQLDDRGQAGPRGASLDRASLRSWLRYLEGRRDRLRRQPARPVQGWTCSGAWYLGVLATGSNVSLGWSIVKEAVSPSRLEARALAGAGLPVYEGFYAKHGNRQVPWLADTTFDDLAAELYPQVRSRTDALGLQPGRGAIRDVDTICQMPETIYSLVLSVLDDKCFWGENGRDRIRNEVRRLLETAMSACLIPGSGDHHGTDPAGSPVRPAFWP